eukprot:TRINITY_DN6150_c0_g1_i1.p1 TRINITY_DN6150_c0_g1~~TRINITY_DN6150_c0_g1_i1.p1  ORF type:complete len:1174 (-),score=216.91 TRINITY_DN6150_c0_g1_i1:67-3513(-)
MLGNYRNDPDSVIALLQQECNSQKANVSVIRQVRVILSQPPNAQWMPEFLEKRGHIAIFTLFQSEIMKLSKAIRIKVLSKDSETIAECCRCTRAILNTDSGIQKVVEIERSLSWLAFSLRFVNSKTQNLVLTALAGICLVSPAGHYRLVAHYSNGQRCLSLKDVFKVNDPEPLYGAFLLINSIINQLDHVRHRTYMRQVFINVCSLRKIIRRISSKAFFGYDKLQTEILVFEEAENVDLRTPDDGNAPPFPGSPDGRVPDISETFGAVELANNLNTNTDFEAALEDDRPTDSTAELKKQIQSLQSQLKACEDEVKTLRALANGGVPLRPPRPAYWMDGSGAGGPSAPTRAIPARPIKNGPEEIQTGVEMDKDGNIEIRPSRKAVFIAPLSRDRDNDDLEHAPLAPGMKNGPPPMTGGPPPPPGMGGPAGAGGPPPPPPPPGMGGGPPPPPPPPPPGMGGGPPPPPGLGLPGMGCPPPPVMNSLPAKKKQTPAVKMKPLMWAKLNKVSGTIWEDIDDEKLFPILNMKDFESNFEAVTKEVAAPPPKKAKEEVHLLPPKRTNHIQIVTRGLKLSPEQVYDAISNLKFSHFPLSTLEGIKSIMPTKEEIQIFKNYDGDTSVLGSAEKFMLQLINIPEIEEKMTAIVFKTGYRDKYEDLEHDVAALHQSLLALKNDKDLPKFLELLLAYGNYMNGTTPRGGIYGFKLNSLIKFADTFSSTRPKMSLLHYIVEIITESENPKLSKLLDFLPRLEILHESSKIMLPDVTERLKHLRYDLAVTDRVLKDPATDELFLNLFAPFHEVASRELQELDDKLVEFNTKYGEMLKYFMEPTSTPSYLFFETWSIFLAKIIKCGEQNMKFKKEAEEAALKKELDLKKGVKTTNSSGSQTEEGKDAMPPGAKGMKMEQGTLDFAIANLKSRGGFNAKVTTSAIMKSDQSATKQFSDVLRGSHYDPTQNPSEFPAAAEEAPIMATQEFPASRASAVRTSPATVQATLQDTVQTPVQTSVQTPVQSPVKPAVTSDASPPPQLTRAATVGGMRGRGRGGLGNGPGAGGRGGPNAGPGQGGPGQGQRGGGQAGRGGMRGGLSQSQPRAGAMAPAPVETFAPRAAPAPAFAPRAQSPPPQANIQQYMEELDPDVAAQLAELDAIMGL